ncbi:uncharacterized protein [Atheta coriaria]|uniref:uncharacterized protein n=1 Tax=Dalotia coriaria TaxID=877792 RepID=UPI0031F41011
MHAIFVCVVACLVFCQVGLNASKHHVKSKQKHHAITKAKPVANISRVVKINEMADVLIREAPMLMDKLHLDPFEAPDQKQFIFPVNLDLTDIKIYNLTSIQRTSDDVVILDNQDLGQMSISLHLIFTKVELHSGYKASIKPLLLPAVSTKGSLVAKVPEINVDIDVIVDFENINVTLKTLRLTMKKRLDVKLSDSLEGQLANLALPTITTILQGVILQVIQNPLKSEINSILHSITGMLHKYLDGMNEKES